MAEYTDIAPNFRAKNQDVALSLNEDAINNSIDNILRISKNEIPGRPEFGSLLENFLYEPLDSLTEDLLREVIREALDEFEPRIEISDITFKRYYNQNILSMNLEYTVISDKNKTIRSFTTALNTI